jgi:hypothetical protein
VNAASTWTLRSAHGRTSRGCKRDIGSHGANANGWRWCRVCGRRPVCPRCRFAAHKPLDNSSRCARCPKCELSTPSTALPPGSDFFLFSETQNLGRAPFGTVVQQRSRLVKADAWRPSMRSTDARRPPMRGDPRCAARMIVTYSVHVDARVRRRTTQPTTASSYAVHWAPGERTQRQHRAPSTEHRAPSTEHRAPSTEHHTAHRAPRPEPGARTPMTASQDGTRQQRSGPPSVRPRGRSPRRSALVLPNTWFLRQSHCGARAPRRPRQAFAPTSR